MDQYPSIPLEKVGLPDYENEVPHLPWVSRMRYMDLLDVNQSLASKLDELVEMREFLGVAQKVKEDILEQFDENLNQSVDEIAEQAYANTLAWAVGRAKDEVVAEYEQAHRETLYEQTYKQIKEEDGSAIWEEVFERLNSDPDLKEELERSAREQLMAEAEEDWRNSVTEKEAEYIAAEAPRRRALDSLDMQFQQEGIVVIDDSVKELFKIGDTLELKFAKKNSDRGGTVLTLVWAEDPETKTKGWILKDEQNNSRYESASYRIPHDRFMQIGVRMPSFVNGEAGDREDELRIKRPLAMKWQDYKDGGFTRLLKSRAEVDYRYKYDPGVEYDKFTGKYFRYHELVLADVDFEVRRGKAIAA
jgi:hypothetical protein